MADFAPYQDAPPDLSRARSPPPQPALPSSRSPPPRSSPPPTSPSPRPNGNRNTGRTSIEGSSSPSYQNADDYFRPGAGWASDAPDAETSVGNGNQGGSGAFWSGRSGIDLYETSLGMRLDWEACLAYLALPPAGSALLLVLEHRSDYVRFHAWQAALLFASTFVIHVIFSWSNALSWIIFAGDVCLICWLTFRAYRDAETLDRYEVPIFGPLASSILDDE